MHSSSFDDCGISHGFQIRRKTLNWDILSVKIQSCAGSERDSDKWHAGWWLMEHVECISIPLSIFTRSTSFIHSAHNHFMCTCVTWPSLSCSLPRHDSVYPSHSSIHEGTGTAKTVQSNRSVTKTPKILLLFVYLTIHSVDHTTITKGEMVVTKKNKK